MKKWFRKYSGAVWLPVSFCAVTDLSVTNWQWWVVVVPSVVWMAEIWYYGGEERIEE
jgi:hypothetical protein